MRIAPRLSAAAVFTLLSVVACGVRPVEARVAIPPPPPGMASAQDRQVLADGQPVFIYEAPVNFNRVYSVIPVTETTPVAAFDFSGTVQITVTAPGKAITSAVLRPRARGVATQISGDKVTFTLDRPGQYTLELNGEIKRALHVFADSIEAAPPKAGDAGLVYFGPGIHDKGEIVLQSNQTLYLAPGALVYGSLIGNNVHNVRVTGRGILCGTRIPRGDGTRNLIHIWGGSDRITLSGVILFDSPSWTVHLRNCSNLLIDDVKIIGARANSDGIDLVSCKNARVDRCFVRAWDDCLCVKSDAGADAGGLHFSNCVIWTDLAQSMEIGYEIRSDLIKGVTFKEIDVLHNFHKPVMSIHNGDHGLVDSVRFENIRVEDASMGQGDGENYLIDLWVGSSVWSQDAERGRIRNVQFNGIAVSGGILPYSRIAGFDAGHRVEDVTLEGLNLLGKPVLQASDGGFTVNGFTANIRFLAGTGIHDVHALSPRRGGVFRLDRDGKMLIRALRPDGSLGVWNARGARVEKAQSGLWPALGKGN